MLKPSYNIISAVYIIRYRPTYNVQRLTCSQSEIHEQTHLFSICHQPVLLVSYLCNIHCWNQTSFHVQVLYWKYDHVGGANRFYCFVSLIITTLNGHLRRHIKTPSYYHMIFTAFLCMQPRLEIEINHRVVCDRVSPVSHGEVASQCARMGFYIANYKPGSGSKHTLFKSSHIKYLYLITPHRCVFFS